METFINIYVVVIVLCSVMFGYFNLSVVIWSSSKSKHKLYKTANILVWLLFFIFLFYCHDLFKIGVEIKSYVALMLVFYLLGMLIRWAVLKINIKTHDKQLFK